MNAENRPVVIAHRGASGALPEHTLEAATLAHAWGADFIEQDVVMSRDNVLIVLHDIHLDTTTNVAAIFPHRHREDGRYYAIDFDWAELTQLTVRERFDPLTGRLVFPNRFPANSASFRLCTMEAQLRLITGLNQTTQRTVGLYPEIKQPGWHHTQGKDVGVALVELLARYDLTTAEDPVFVQCFEAAELIRLRSITSTQLRFVQLIGLNSWGHANADYDKLQIPEGLKKIATYAQGIGPHLAQILVGKDQTGAPLFSSLVADAHSAGLVVHPYTLRSDELPAGVPHFDALLQIIVNEAGIDGLFTDHADKVINFLRPKSSARE